MTEALSDRLRQIASDGYSRRLTADDIESPDFAAAEWLASWEWYVEPSLREAWAALSVESKWVACIAAIKLWRRENEAVH